jgi:translation initiation factor 4E
MWYDAPYLHKDSGAFRDKLKWLRGIKNMHDFDTVETFWRLYNNIPKACELCYKSGYFVVECNTLPYWGDVNHLNGGTLKFHIPFSEDVERAWLTFLLSFIGGDMEYTIYATGLYIIKMKQYYEIGIYLRISDELIINYMEEFFAAKLPKKIEPKKIEPKKIEPKKIEPKKIEPKFYRHADEFKLGQ